jgi:thiosulfate reductase cytochrome b subunit
MAESLLTGTLENKGDRPNVRAPAAPAGVDRLEDCGLGHTGHARWVRISHWILALSALTLAFSGFVILMAHPRLYWGAVGNDLTPALVELPISRNYRHGGWAPSIPFFSDVSSPVSAVRTYDILNKNSWGRSLHFLAAWFLVVTAAVYVAIGVCTGHVRRHLVPRGGEFTPRLLWRDLIGHLRFQTQPTTGGPPYSLLQKCTYFAVVFLALPLAIVTGLAMSPAIAAAYPVLQDVWGGFQSARTIHFFTFAALILFIAVHVLMVILSGFKRQVRAMTLGS